ncbi:hypothetical protein [Desulfomicrobium escambiense]|uniref:hypothetical protein n=1 Tax=Desulfomicrobium escambiense TaxID=29503 RepID=UPI0012EB50B2|nr:hypothetical protein [Desulfomicrobium escambiense]
MDLDEYALTEAQRTLKRLGITHLWRQKDSALQEPAPAVANTVATALDTVPLPASPRRPAQKPSQTEEPVPPLLRSLFHGKQSPVRTLWTYAGLFADMQQPTPPPRLDMFRKIQASVRSHLGWPENDICAWPLDVAPELFAQGMRFFVPRIIICFGPASPVSGDPNSGNAVAVFGSSELRLLPNLEDMAAGDKQLKNDAWQILQGIRS